MASTGDVFTLTADGQTPTFRATGTVHISLTGSFGGGTAKLQARTPRGSWVDIAEASFTYAVNKLCDFPGGAETDIRIDLSSATAPSLVVWFQAADR